MSIRTKLATTFDYSPGSMPRRVMGLAWPSVMEQSLITLVGLVDTFIVGHLGAEAIAAVGLGTMILNWVSSLMVAIGVGTTAVVAREVGGRRQEEANIVSGQGLLIAGFIGAASSLVAYLFAPNILSWFGGEASVQTQGVAWLTAAAPSFFFIGIMVVGNAAMRGAGDTRTPLMIMIVSSGLTVVLAWILTRTLNWGVSGNGTAVTLGYIVGAALSLGALFTRRGAVIVSPSHLVPDRAYIGRILNIGLPAGAEQIMLQTALAYSAVLITGYGTAAYAAHQIGLRLSALSYLPGWGFSIAATTLVGQELGANNPAGARAACSSALTYAMIIMCAMGVALFAFDEAIVRIFTDDQSVIKEGTSAIIIGALIQPIMAYSFVHGGSLRGAGDTRTTMLITMTSVWGLRIVFTYLLGTVFGLGLPGAWIAIGIDFLLRGLLFSIRWRGGKWAVLTV
jgi:putative MATE family efflux protein